ncbi:hypothetical protein [uncultured Oscillibacter sp.]|uniref:hypothetical protein n=1 Tax=uncultured Oscillibacter sp. TaxID=876091 RepID=UPI002609139A|nr:hypothetical protein [uncultured Oscillibacter sp.]
MAQFQSSPTPTALGIFANIQARSNHAVYLCRQDAGPALTFGMSRTRAVRYMLHLSWHGHEVKRQTDDHQSFAILLDRGGPERALRLVFYDGMAPQPVIDFNGKDGGLVGQILIQAHAERSDDEAIIHAIFNRNGESSLVIDADQELLHHLILAASMQEEGTTDGLF